VLATPRSIRSALAGGGDLDVPRDSEEPVAPNTFVATKLDDRDFITASTMIKELVASSDASTASPSVIGMRSPVSAIIKDGSAMASSPSGDPTLKRVVVRPLVEDKLNDCSPLAEDAMAGPLLQLRLITCLTPDTQPTPYQ
jgi:hypothetical protein